MIHKSLALICLLTLTSGLFGQSTCTPNNTTLCLQGGRFQVTLTYVNGATAAGKAVPLSDESGTFWFFNSQNAEVLVKVLDGTPVNGNYWVFHSAMTHLQYNLTVTDWVTGISQTYQKDVNDFCGDADLSTFVADGSAPKVDRNDDEYLRLFQLGQFNEQRQLPLDATKTGPECSSSNTTLCLQSNRFQVGVTYIDPNNGQTVAAQTRTYGDETGFFYFFNPANVEIGVKVLDAVQSFGYYWVYISGATTLNYTVTVTDTVTNLVRSYPTAGGLCGQNDNQSFGNPEIRLQRAGTVINPNSTVPVGNTPYNQPLESTFTIYNDGNGPLTIEDLDWDGNEIGLVDAPPVVIPKNDSGTFTLSFGAGSGGTFTRQIRLTTTDPGPNPLAFNATWTVADPIGPIIRLKQGSNVISQGQTVDFGNTGVGQPLHRTFTVENVGDQPLTVAPISISSHTSDPSSFDVEHNNVINVQPGNSSTFGLDFDAAGLGIVTSEIRLFEGGVSRFSFFAKGTVLEPDFSISMNPSSRTVDPGQNAFYTVSLNALYGFTGSASLSISGLPSGANPSFTPGTVSQGASSQLRIHTTASINPGSYPFTVTGTSNGTTRTATATLVVEDPSDFTVSVTPDQRQVTQGSSTTYVVNVTGTNGFDGSVALSLTGLPANTTKSFNPVSIMPGQSSTLTINTTAQTPASTHNMTVRGQNSGRTRTKAISLIVNEASANEPVITSTNPDHIDGGQQTNITLQGQNLQGATVEIAQDPAEPGDPLPTAFPLVSVITIASDGTSMTVHVDARNGDVSGFYSLVITTPGGETGTVFRVVTNGPQVDAWSPSEPARGKVYQLLIMGLNMRNATVTSGHIGIETFVIGTTDTHINGFMIVDDNAALGNSALFVTNNGVTVQLPINVVATSSALLGETNLFAERAQQALASGVVVPEVFLQDLTFDPSLALSASGAKDDKGLCFVTLGWTIYSYNYTVALPFDPLTGKIDRRVLTGLGLGETIPAGVKIFSAFVDLYLEVQFRCFPVSHIQVCIYGNVGAEIPGVAGIILSAGGCFFGGAFFPWANTSGHIAGFNFGTSNSCSSAVPTSVPSEGGNQTADVTLNDCCESDLLASVSGTSFPEVPSYSWDFEGFGVPVFEITPGEMCIDPCGCEGVAGVPAHGSNPLVYDTVQPPPLPSILHPRTGRVRFVGSGLSNFRVIPEDIPDPPSPGDVMVPVLGQTYDTDGFLMDMPNGCCTMWFKIPGRCSVLIIANGSSFTGYYHHGVGSGPPSWRNAEICPVAENYHLGVMVNPFCNPLCLSTTATCSITRMAVFEPNLFENVGFEDGTTAPFTQGVNRGVLSPEINPSHVHSGSSSLRHESTGDPGTWSPTFPWNGNNQVDVTLDGSDTYRFSTMAKASAPNTRVRLYIFAKDAAGATSAPYYTGKAFTIGTEWEQLSITHTIQPGFKYATIRVDVKEPGTVWWDDFRFDSVDNLIENPGFEQQKSVSVVGGSGPFSHAQKGFLQLDKAFAHNGLASLKHTADDNDSYTQFYHGRKAAGLTEVATGEEAYRLTVWARADVNTPIQLRIFGLDEAFGAVENELSNGTATSGWKPFTVELTPSAETEFISIRLDNDGGPGAEVWWDDLVLERILP